MRMIGKPAAYKQSGFTLIESIFALLIASTIIGSLALALRAASDSAARAGDSNQFAQYVNGIAAYMSAQGTTVPATLNRTGTDWLKSVDCGGNQPADDFFLSCRIPNDFNGDYGLGQPIAVFDWSEPRAPAANITFGVVVGESGNPSPPIAARLVQEINARLETGGYQFAEAFMVNPAIVGGAAAAAELAQANLRAFVDMSIESTVFVRLDGNSIMRGTLVNENDSWAMITRDAAGTENTSPVDQTASINSNDLYVRSVDAWASETHELAEEAYRVAIRAPLFVSNVRSGATISKPTCPAPLVRRISAVPAGFVGGPSPSDPRYIAGVRTRVVDNGGSYNVFMDILYDGQSNFQTVASPPSPQSNMGLINVSIKCSDA